MPFRPPPPGLNSSSHHSSGGGPKPSSTRGVMPPTLSAEDEEIAVQYRKMLKMGMPEGAVTHKMAMYGVGQHIIDAVVPPEEEIMEPKVKGQGNPAGLTTEEEEIASKYRKMLTMGMPDGAVAQKMGVDEVPLIIQEAVFAAPPDETKESEEEKNQSSNFIEDDEEGPGVISSSLSGENGLVPPNDESKSDHIVSTVETEKVPPTKTVLTEAEEEVKMKYCKMLSMGMPEGAVSQKMEIDEVPQNIQDAVFAQPPVEAGNDEHVAEAPVLNEKLYNVDDMKAQEEQKEAEQMTEENLSPVQENQLQNIEANEDPPTAKLNEFFHKSGETAIEFYSSDDSFEEEEVIEDELVDEALADEPTEEIQDAEEDSSPSESGTEHSEDFQRVEEAETHRTGQDKTSPWLGAQSEPRDSKRVVAFEEVMIVEKTDDEFEEEIIFEKMDVFEMIDESTSSHDEGTLQRQPGEGMGTGLYQDRGTNQASSRERRTESLHPDRTFHRLVFLAFVLLIGAGVAVSLVFMLDDDETTQEAGAPTTSMDAINLDSCDFSDSVMPNVIDQCRCLGAIEIIPGDVRDRYQIHLQDFIPQIYEDFDESISSCSVRNQALVWLSTGNDYVFSELARSERYALANFFIGTQGQSWTESTNWLSRSYVCSWFGIKCSSGRVREITLTANDLAGSIPVEIILLQRLSNFSVSQNGIGGEILQEFFFIPALVSLLLNDNEFLGNIPSAIQEALRLKTLDLESNNLGGTIPDDIDQATSLESLNLANNAFRGTMPTSMFGLSKLTSLQLRSNNIEGSIPTSISRLSSLQFLDLSSNFLDGSLPSSIGDITTLEKLVLQDLDLNGRIPVDIFGKLTDLLELVITETGIGGSLPASLARMSNIVVLNLDTNQIRGEIPSDLNKLTTLRLLNLSGNLFSGTIPTQLGTLSNLLELRLTDNDLIGDIPSALGGLEDLEIMTLDGNILQGTVPQRVCNLRRAGSLEELIVDCAAIECAIPECCTSCQD